MCVMRHNKNDEKENRQQLFSSFFFNFLYDTYILMPHSICSSFSCIHCFQMHMLFWANTHSSKSCTVIAVIAVIAFVHAVLYVQFGFLWFLSCLFCIYCSIVICSFFISWPLYMHNYMCTVGTMGIVAQMIEQIPSAKPCM